MGRGHHAVWGWSLAATRLHELSLFERVSEHDHVLPSPPGRLKDGGWKEVGE